jgi:hypothetical protein
MKVINGEKRGRPGRWLLDFTDQNGKRRWETFPTQKEAKAALSRRLEELRKGIYHAPTEMPTLREVAEAWLVRKAVARRRTKAFFHQREYTEDTEQQSCTRCSLRSPWWI